MSMSHPFMGGRWRGRLRVGREEGVGARTGVSPPAPLITQQKGLLAGVYKDIFPLGNSMRRGVTNLDDSQVKKRIVGYPKKRFKDRDRYSSQASCLILALSMLMQHKKKLCKAMVKNSLYRKSFKMIT